MSKWLVVINYLPSGNSTPSFAKLLFSTALWWYTTAHLVVKGETFGKKKIIIRKQIVVKFPNVTWHFHRLPPTLYTLVKHDSGKNFILMASKLTHPPAIIHLNPKHNEKKMGISEDILCSGGFWGGLTVLIKLTQPIEPIQKFREKKSMK